MASESRLSQIIANNTRRIEVDNRLSLRFYYRTAANLLRQANIYRDERNVIELYVILLRFSSLISETIPYHHDYRVAHLGERAEYRKKLADVVGELEFLKPEVQRQLNRLNRVHQLHHDGEGADITAQWPSAPRTPVFIERPEEFRKEISHFGSAIYHGPPPRAGDYWRSPSVRGTIDEQLSKMSLNIPRPRDETLSRHSILGPHVGRRQNPAVPFRAQYPNYIDASPIELPSFEQNWRAPSDHYAIPDHSSTIEFHSGLRDPLAEPVLWPEADSSSFRGGYALVVRPDLAPAPSLVRQPEPPPVLAHLQTQENLDHPPTQLPSERVADPRPCSPHVLEDGFSPQKGAKDLHVSPKMMEEFLALARLNTQKRLETCAILAGALSESVFYVSALIIPKQEATSDSCQTVNEEEIFDYQDKSGLFQLGWIHTHPTQSCFMSSIDLHTQYSYQVMLQEAIAIVMAPTDDQRKHGIFRLSDPGGIKSIQGCDRRGFHPHEEPLDGSPLYEHCGHVFMNPRLKFKVVDLRQG